MYIYLSVCVSLYFYVYFHWYDFSFYLVSVIFYHFFNPSTFRSDAVRIGDRLLAINEITLRGKPLWKAFELLRTAGDTVKLLIKRDLSSMSVKQTVGKITYYHEG